MNVKWKSGGKTFGELDAAAVFTSCFPDAPVVFLKTKSWRGVNIHTGQIVDFSADHPVALIKGTFLVEQCDHD